MSLGGFFLHCRIRPITSKALQHQTQVFTHPVVSSIAQTKRSFSHFVGTPAGTRDPMSASRLDPAQRHKAPKLSRPSELCSPETPHPTSPRHASPLSSLLFPGSPLPLFCSGRWPLGHKPLDHLRLGGPPLSRLPVQVRPCCV